MITIGSFTEKLKKSMENLKLVSEQWKKSSFGEKYEIDDISFSKKCLFIYTDSAIMKKDIEINADEIIRQLNKNLPGRKFVKKIEVKVGKR
jgi:hypothetical protein